MDFLEDPLAVDYVNTKHPNQGTINARSCRLRKYFTFLNKSATEIIETAEDEEDERLRMRKRTIKADLENFLEYLIGEEYSVNYIKANMGTVKGFYRYHGIERPDIEIHIKNEQRFTVDDIIQKEHIIKALKYADVKWKAVILTMASSGMGAGEMMSLTLDDLKHSLSKYGVKSSTNVGEIIDVVRENKDAVIRWDIRRVKTGMPYFTFSSPESLLAIADYLEDYNGKKYLFCAPRGGQLWPGNVVYSFGKINTACGFGKVGSQRFFHSHGLRPFFGSAIIRNKIELIYADWMLGHAINPQRESYFKAYPDAVKTEYLKVLPDLTVVDKVKTRVITDERLAELEEQNKALEERIMNLERNNQERFKDEAKKLP